MHPLVILGYGTGHVNLARAPSCHFLAVNVRIILLHDLFRRKTPDRDELELDIDNLAFGGRGVARRSVSSSSSRARCRVTGCWRR